LPLPDAYMYVGHSMLHLT